MAEFRVCVDRVDRFEVNVEARDPQDALLQIEHGEVTLTPDGMVSRTINPIHVKAVNGPAFQGYGD